MRLLLIPGIIISTGVCAAKSAASYLSKKLLPPPSKMSMEYATATETLIGIVNILETIDEYNALNEVRRSVIIEMSLNIDFVGLLSMPGLWEALECKDYSLASEVVSKAMWSEMDDGQLSKTLSRMMKYGE